MPLVLLLEVEPVVAAVCTTIVEHAGFSVYVTGSAESAFEYYRQNQREIHAIVADASNPLPAGADLARRIFQQDAGARIILMTTYREIPADLAATCAVLGKPFCAGQLHSALCGSAMRRAGVRA